jgi:hypothetical protein
MGLDMYLQGEKYLSNDWKNPQNDLREDGYEVRSKILRLGYWRKHPNLHGYIVTTFAGGIDNCKPIHLDEADIEKTIDAVARDDLPHTEGFFFGVSDGTEKDETIRIFTAVLTWLRTEEHMVFRSVHYQASW